MKDARGLHMIKKGKETEKMIIKWLSENKNATKAQACDELGITYQTLRKHLKSIGELDDKRTA